MQVKYGTLALSQVLLHSEQIYLMAMWSEVTKLLYHIYFSQQPRYCVCSQERPLERARKVVCSGEWPEQWGCISYWRGCYCISGNTTAVSVVEIRHFAGLCGSFADSQERQKGPEGRTRVTQKQISPQRGQSQQRILYYPHHQIIGVGPGSPAGRRLEPPIKRQSLRKGSSH